MQSQLDCKSRRHTVKGLAIDTENFRGAFAVAACGIQNVENVTTFQFVEARQSRKEIGKIVGREVAVCPCLSLRDEFKKATENFCVRLST